MEDRQRVAPTELIPMPRQAGSSPTEPGVLRDPGPNPPLIERAQLLSISAIVLVLLLLVLTMAALMPRSPDDETLRAESGAGLDAGLTSDGDQALIDLERIDEASSRQLLKGSGFTVKGTIERSWTWTDRNGFNLATTSLTARGPAPDPVAVTLNVTQLANLDGRPRRLQAVTDPVNCDHRGRLRAGFTPGSFRVSDLDGDGTAEISVGWWFSCDDGQPDATTVKLLLLSDGTKFVRRGTGPAVATDAGVTTDAAAGKGADSSSQELSGTAADPAQQRILVPLASFSAEPRASRWPKAFWDQSQELLTSLHGTP